jgi:hypothetical protein
MKHSFLFLNFILTQAHGFALRFHYFLIQFLILLRLGVIVLLIGLVFLLLLLMLLRPQMKFACRIIQVQRHLEFFRVKIGVILCPRGIF